MFADVKKNESHCGLLKQWLESSLVTMEITKTGFHRYILVYFPTTNNNRLQGL